MIFNYKRVSTTDQNTERQLLNVACDREYVEKISGKNTNRPELQAMLLNIRAGDVVNVHSMDRLARNTKDLLNLVEEITNKVLSLRYKNNAKDYIPTMQLVSSFTNKLKEQGYKKVSESNTKVIYKNNKYQVTIMEEFDYLIIVMVKL